MASLDDNERIEDLLKRVDSGDSSVRTNALRILLGLKERRAIRPAVSMLSSEFGWVRREAAIYLSSLAGIEEVPDLIGALDDENVDVVFYCVEGLARIGDERSIKPLVRLFQKQLEKYSSMTDAGHPTFVALSKLSRKYDVSVFD